MPKFNVRFTLNRAIRRPFKSKCGISALGEKGQKFLWVKGIEADSPEDAVGRALELANRLLDQHAFEHGEALQILETTKFIECEDEDGRKIGIHMVEETISLHVEMSATVRKYGPNGTLESISTSDDPVDLTPTDMDGLRFYRRARVAEDLHNWFEAFREYFRAIEWATTEIRGEWKKGGQSLTEVLQDVFADEKSREHLEHIASKCPSFPQNYGDRLFEEVAKYLYERHRCALDHAKSLKSYKSYKLPFDPEAENEVRGALGLARYVARELLAYLEKRSSG